MSGTEPVRVLVVMGVSGSGKSTLAQCLGAALKWPVQEGDDLHSVANREKMAGGTPLSDADRWPWLGRVRRWIDERLAAGEAGVITCSALKRSYRDLLAGPGVVFVYPAGDRATIMERLRNRHGHFMPPALLDSQLATLEPPTSEEDAVAVSLGDTPEEECQRVLEQLAGRLPS